MTTHVASPVKALLGAALAAMLVAGCASGTSGQPGAGASSSPDVGPTGGGSPTATSTSGTDTSAEPSKSADVVVKAAVRDGEVRPPSRRVEVQQGQVVRLVVRSDHEDAVHVHGYDLEQKVSPGDPAVLTFAADVPGVFEVETHHPALQVLQFQVQ